MESSSIKANPGKKSRKIELDILSQEERARVRG
jgi:hypothetical protein